MIRFSFVLFAYCFICADQWVICFVHCHWMICLLLQFIWFAHCFNWAATMSDSLVVSFVHCHWIELRECDNKLLDFAWLLLLIVEMLFVLLLGLLTVDCAVTCFPQLYCFSCCDNRLEVIFDDSLYNVVTVNDSYSMSQNEWNTVFLSFFNNRIDLNHCLLLCYRPM